MIEVTLVDAYKKCELEAEESGIGIYALSAINCRQS